MSTVKPLPFETYLAVIKNSVGTSLFKQGFAGIDGKKTDIMRGGELSCAFFVSSVLKIFNLVHTMHANVDSTVKDMENSGWQGVDTAEVGDVIAWKPTVFPDGQEHAHIGFVIGPNQAISNDYIRGTPQLHSLNQTPDGTPRQIARIYRGRHLFESSD